MGRAFSYRSVGVLLILNIFILAPQSWAGNSDEAPTEAPLEFHDALYRFNNGAVLILKFYKDGLPDQVQFVSAKSGFQFTVPIDQVTDFPTAPLGKNHWFSRHSNSKAPVLLRSERQGNLAVVQGFKNGKPTIFIFDEDADYQAIESQTLLKVGALADRDGAPTGYNLSYANYDAQNKILFVKTKASEHSFAFLANGAGFAPLGFTPNYRDLENNFILGTALEEEPNFAQVDNYNDYEPQKAKQNLEEIFNLNGNDATEVEYQSDEDPTADGVRTALVHVPKTFSPTSNYSSKADRDILALYPDLVAQLRDRDDVFKIRDQEALENLTSALNSKDRKSVFIRGPSGSSKTEFVYSFAKLIGEGAFSEISPNTKILTVDAAFFAAGTPNRGMAEKKVAELIAFTQRHPNDLIFIDEAGTMKGTVETSQAIPLFLV